MKNLKAFFALVSLALVGFLSIIFNVPTASAYSWTPNFDETTGKGTVNFINQSNDDFELWMYDYDEGMSDSLNIWNASTFYTTKDVHFSRDGSSIYWADLYDPKTLSALDLGSTPEYGLYFVKGGTTYSDYDIEKVTNDVWKITFGDGEGTLLLSVDATPVPLPPSVLLLGSGIFGLVGVGLRRRRKRSS